MINWRGYLEIKLRFYNFGSRGNFQDLNAEISGTFRIFKIILMQLMFFAPSISVNSYIWHWNTRWFLKYISLLENSIYKEKEEWSRDYYLIFQGNKLLKISPSNFLLKQPPGRKYALHLSYQKISKGIVCTQAVQNVKWITWVTALLKFKLCLLR